MTDAEDSGVIEKLVPALLRGAAYALSMNAHGRFKPEERLCVQAADLIERLQAALTAERERAERNEKDAKRYRWVRDSWPNTVSSAVFGKDGWTEPEQLDAAIDAAKGEP